MSAMATENMFQEGLYQVFVKARPSQRHSQVEVTHNVELDNVRIHRWFGSVVNTRLLLSGLMQILSSVACTLSTVTHACVSYDCSVSMTTPAWSSLFFFAAGCLAVAVQRSANKLKIIILMSLNIFTLVFGFSAALAFSIRTRTAVPLNTHHQLAGSYIAMATSVIFTVLCMILSIYVIFLSWRGLHRYSPPHVNAYNRVSQESDDTSGPLLEQVELNM
ncbi:transmembrane protein 253 [Synchiropus picturatus]